MVNVRNLCNGRAGREQSKGMGIKSCWVDWCLREHFDLRPWPMGSGAAWFGIGWRDGCENIGMHHQLATGTSKHIIVGTPMMHDAFPVFALFETTRLSLEDHYCAILVMVGHTICDRWHVCALSPQHRTYHTPCLVIPCFVITEITCTCIDTKSCPGTLRAAVAST